MVTINDDNAPKERATTSGAGQLDVVIQQAIARLQSVYQLLPEFVTASAEGVNAMRTASTVSDEFLVASAVAAEDDPAMQTFTGLDPDKTRLVIMRNLRFEPLAAAADALARDIRYNMFRERWEVVQQALHLYALARRSIRYARNASLVAHVHAMKKALGPRGRRRKVKPVATPEEQ
jgi:hypothetical protein